jgi:hypothetical protein
MPNDANTPTTQTEFVFRRLAEGFSLFGVELHPFVWVAILAVVLALGIAYVVWMYRKDRASIPLGFAILLALLRISVYLLLGLAFLLPAKQTWERAEKNSRVAILIDVSDSMTRVSDELPGPGKPLDQLETRMDKVLKFLSDKDVDFLARLMKTNPVVVYRFGTRLDEEFAAPTANRDAWSPDDWKKWIHMDPKQWVLQGVSSSGRKAMMDHAPFQGDKPGNVEWAVAWLKTKEDADFLPPVTPQSGFGEEDRQKLKENAEKLEKRLEVSRQLLQGTNVGESVLAALNREATNMLQGLVVISDGRSNLGAETLLKDVRDRAKRENIPVFTVVVGEDREPISIQIVDVQTPEQAPPDERFVVRAEVDGVGLAGREKPVMLDIFKPGDDPKKAKPIHTINAKLTFAPGEPPHAQIEFAIDPTAGEGPDKLPPEFFKQIRKPEPGAKPEEPMPGAKPAEEQFSTGKPELIEGEWKFVVRVPKDENEAFVGKEHLSDIVSVQVIKKPLRVLLFAGGAERDFQFVRTILVREKDQKRAELSVFVQNLGRDGRDVQDVEPERRLNRFPNQLLVGEAAAKLDPKEKYYNLDQYDVIIAFDPDWSELDAQQYKMLKTWVERQAGGLIIVGGPIHTFQLARAAEADKLQSLAELFPVVPGDSVLPVNPAAGLTRNTKKAWYLNFPGANKDMEFLKLDDDKPGPLAGWDEFFFRKDKRDPRDTDAFRGFYGFYPIQSVKKGATVVATFADPAARMQDGSEHPFLVTMDYPQGKIVFLGGELWRLRSYKEMFFERFWIKLARYASSGTRVRQNKRGVLVMGKQFTAGNFVRLEAQMFGPDSNPLPETAEIKGFISPLTSDDPKQRKEVKLTAKRSAVNWGGWFQGRHLISNPGEYKVEIPIPGTPDALRGKFTVRESNPELDLVRPDFAAMHQIAGELDEIAARLDKPTVDKVRSVLIGRRVKSDKPAAPMEGDKPPEGETARSESPRLYFDLKTAGLIPDLMTAQTKVQRNRGPVTDLWDQGPTVGHDNRGQPIVLPWLLAAVVGLFSAEWLTRKLLRLA